MVDHVIRCLALARTTQKTCGPPPSGLVGASRLARNSVTGGGWADRDSGVPGPAQYNDVEAFSRLHSTVRQTVGFGAPPPMPSDQENNNDKAAASVPGPGTYDPSLYDAFGAASRKLGPMIPPLSSTDSLPGGGDPTKVTPGPGEYDILNAMRQGIINIPNISIGKADRELYYTELMKTAGAIPGPGSYDTTTQQQGGDGGGGSAGATFGTSQRLPTDGANTNTTGPNVGPGSYYNPDTMYFSDFHKDVAQRGQGGVPFILPEHNNGRLPGTGDGGAAGFPGPAQYNDVDAFNRLHSTLAQTASFGLPPPPPPYGGAGGGGKGDAPGPGQYDVHGAFHYLHGGVPFATINNTSEPRPWDKEKNSEGGEGGGAGPGEYYDARHDKYAIGGDPGKGWTMGMRLGGGKDGKDGDIPGPGMYDINAADRMVYDGVPNVSASAFKLPTYDEAQNPHAEAKYPKPGPGHYSMYNYNALSQLQGPDAGAATFGKAVRFADSDDATNDNDKQQPTPGPGHYNVHDIAAMERLDAFAPKIGPGFGIPHYHQGGSAAVPPPGPGVGHYNERDALHWLWGAYQHASGTSLSKAPRPLGGDGDGDGASSGPGPGQYHTSGDNNGAYVLPDSGGALTFDKAARFPDNRNDNDVGPGSYTLPRGFPHSSQGGHIGSGQRGVKEWEEKKDSEHKERIEATPGPGHYNYRDHGQATKGVSFAKGSGEGVGLVGGEGGGGGRSPDRGDIGSSATFAGFHRDLSRAASLPLPFPGASVPSFPHPNQQTQTSSPSAARPQQAAAEPNSASYSTNMSRGLDVNNIPIGSDRMASSSSATTTTPSVASRAVASIPNVKGDGHPLLASPSPSAYDRVSVSGTTSTRSVTAAASPTTTTTTTTTSKTTSTASPGYDPKHYDVGSKTPSSSRTTASLKEKKTSVPDLQGRLPRGGGVTPSSSTVSPPPPPPAAAATAKPKPKTTAATTTPTTTMTTANVVAVHNARSMPDNNSSSTNRTTNQPTRQPVGGGAIGGAGETTTATGTFRRGTSGLPPKPAVPKIVRKK